MTNERAKAIRKSRRELNKAMNNYINSGDVTEMFALLEKQNALTETYEDASMKFYRM